MLEFQYLTFFDAFLVSKRLASSSLQESESDKCLVLGLPADRLFPDRPAFLLLAVRTGLNIRNHFILKSLLLQCLLLKNHKTKYFL